MQSSLLINPEASPSFPLDLSRRRAISPPPILTTTEIAPESPNNADQLFPGEYSQEALSDTAASPLFSPMARLFRHHSRPTIKRIHNLRKILGFPVRNHPLRTLTPPPPPPPELPTSHEQQINPVFMDFISMSNNWQDDFIEAVQLCREQQKKILLFLDYDGTLREICNEPHEAAPTPQILTLLQNLHANPHFHVVMISGRNRQEMQEWFGHLNLTLYAEHGIVKWSNGSWIVNRQIANLPLITVENFKNICSRLLAKYTGHILQHLKYHPACAGLSEEQIQKNYGAHTEIKPYGLVWHYRKPANILAPEVVYGLCKDLANEIKQTYAPAISLNFPENPESAKALKEEFLLTQQDRYQVTFDYPSKIIELSPAAINKGSITKAEINNLRQENIGLIAAFGDSETDESTFEVLQKLKIHSLFIHKILKQKNPPIPPPSRIFTVKVEEIINKTAAMCNIETPKDIRTFLEGVLDIYNPPN